METRRHPWCSNTFVLRLRNFWKTPNDRTSLQLVPSLLLWPKISWQFLNSPKFCKQVNINRTKFEYTELPCKLSLAGEYFRRFHNSLKKTIVTLSSIYWLESKHSKRPFLLKTFFLLGTISVWLRFWIWKSWLSIYDAAPRIQLTDASRL
jgi:hypothetical protein